MNVDRVPAMEAYLDGCLLSPDFTLAATLQDNAAAGLPEIDVSPSQGKLLYLLAKLHVARRILEVGTLGGYSTIWLARAVPDGGSVTTLELEADRAEVARRNVDRAGIGNKVEIVVGPAAETLPRLDAPYDFAFIDADKPNNPIYWREALRLVRPGGMIIVDNVVRDGLVADDETDDPGAKGVRAMMDIIRSDPRVEATAVQTVANKAYDGFLIARVRD